MIVRDVTAIIPLKALGRAKGRLTGTLDDATRRELVAWMFARVVAACLESRSVGSVLAVVGDAEAACLAAEHGVAALVEPRLGLDAALSAADTVTAEAPASLVIAADLPLATAKAVNAVCAVGASEPCVVVVPTRDGGTGALLRRPPGVIATRYGTDSAAAHLRLADQAGVASLRVDIPPLAFDVDTPDQLREAARLDEQARRWASV